MGVGDAMMVFMLGGPLVSALVTYAALLVDVWEGRDPWDC